MSPNRYLNYYQGKLYREQPNRCINQIAKGHASSIVPSEKQIKYYNDLLTFAKAHGLEKAEVFEGMKTKRNIGSAISGLINLIRNNGLMDEWLERGKKANADIQNEQ